MQHTGLLVAAIVAACVFNVARAAPPTNYKVVPAAPVKKDPPAHPRGSVGGTFQLVESADGFAPIKVENGKPFISGGACLVFQDTAHVRTCGKQSDCTSNAPEGPENGFGYCHAESGTCWFKKTSDVTIDPDNHFILDDYCVKSGPQNTLVVDKVCDMPNPKGPPNTRRWRLTACQGLTQLSCKDGVENTDFHTWWSEVLEP